MNLKNSWKELRIWLGWRVKRMMILSLVVFMVIVFSMIGWMLFHPANGASLGKLVVLETIADHFLLACVFWFSIFLFLSILVRAISIRKMPKNWRLVIEDAKKLKEEFGLNSDIETQIVLVRGHKNGERLYELVNGLQKLQQKRSELKKLTERRDTLPAEIYELETRIQALERETIFTH